MSGLGQPGKVSPVQMVEECRGRDPEKTGGMERPREKELEGGTTSDHAQSGTKAGAW